MRCIVRVAVATQPIRALFAGEKPPVPDDEWDEAAYVAQRLRAYAEALEGIALVQPMPGTLGDGASFSCPRTGDLVRIEPDDRNGGVRGDPYADIERALQRVFADAHAWRRHLLPAYFERHRHWRALVGNPIQH
ncbi:MAG: hypothetical protein DCC72_04905 [Burkholderiales bacterium]|jgi:hypothetical protein|nr:MAG: hypothetical protein DCC72_04905 [Burkholderiales bacterium]